MRFRLFVSFAIVALWARASSTSAQRSSSPDALATLVLEPLHGASVSEWKARVPAATWQRYRGTYEQVGNGPEELAHRGVQPSGLWCAVATDRRGEIERVAVFFALRHTTPAACRIELMEGVARQRTEQQAATLFSDVSALISQRLGVSAHVLPLSTRDIPEPYGGGSGYPEGIERWDEGVVWHPGDRDVFLFRAARAVGFSSRSSLLTPESEDAGEPSNVAQEAELRLATTLRDRFPSAAAVMPFAFAPQHQVEIRAALIELLDARAGATPEDQAMLTFAADRLARKLWVDPPFPSGHPELLPLRRRQVGFVRDPYDRWLYDGAFSRTVLRLWPGTSWGQVAFVTHLYEGYTEDGCDGGAYAKVIRYGNAWLESHADSPWRTTVMTALARAYEAKWALNGTFTADARQNARVVTEAQATARLNAIKLYDEVIRLAPGSEDANYARRRIVPDSSEHDDQPGRVQVRVSIDHSPIWRHVVPDRTCESLDPFADTLGL